MTMKDFDIYTGLDYFSYKEHIYQWLVKNLL